MMIEDTAGEAYVRTLVHGEYVEMLKSEYDAHYSPMAIRRRVGKHLFGEANADAFARGGFRP